MKINSILSMAVTCLVASNEVAAVAMPLNCKLTQSSHISWCTANIGFLAAVDGMISVEKLKRDYEVARKGEVHLEKWPYGVGILISCSQFGQAHSGRRFTLRA